MITMQVEKVLRNLNINYEYYKTGRLLKELAKDGLIDYEERTSKIKLGE